MNGRELFCGLTRVSYRYIDEAENGILAASPKGVKKHTRLRRPLLIAALAALLLLLVGCGAAYIITRNLGWSKELEQDLIPYNEGTAIGAVSKSWLLEDAMLTFSAAPPENGTVKITCTEFGRDSTGTLDVGAEYWIEKWNGTTYEEIPTLDGQPWMVSAQKVICGTEVSWTVNYLESYGALAPGNYRVGMMVSKPTEGEAETYLGCFAKFRVPEPNLAPYLEAYNKAFLALKNADGYHLVETEYCSLQVQDLTFQSFRTEYWKSGSDWVECRTVQELNAETFNDDGGGQMRRDGLGYGVVWPTGKVTDKPSSWERLTFVDDFEPMWSVLYENISQFAEDVQDCGSYVNFVENIAGDYMEFRVFYDGEGAIQRLEWSNIPGLSYEETDRTVWQTVEVLPTTAQEAAEVLRAIDLTTPSQFSYQEDLQTIETSGYAKKTDGFQNSTPQGKLTIDSAARLAALEVPTDKTNITTVFYDQEANIWKVEFTYSQNDDIYYAVYLNADGIPQLVVSK